MQYTGYDQLNVIRLKDGQDTVPFEVLAKSIPENPTTVIYCESEGKLFGIISSGDILRAQSAGENSVSVNKKFTKLLPDESMKARKIFNEKKNINAIPIVNESGELLGDYKRCDKLNLKILGKVEKQRFEQSEKVFLPRPCGLLKEKQRIHRELENFLLSMGVTARSINWNEVIDYINEADKVLVADLDEHRAMRVILVLSGLENASYKIWTYKEYMVYAYKNAYMERYLGHLKSEGISVLNLVFREDTVHSKELSAKIHDKLLTWDRARKSRKAQEEFFCELYTPEYADNIINLPFSSAGGISGKLKDCESELCNVTNGERYTEGWPKRYQKTIYFVGPCFIYGQFVEDKYTLESFLQGHINDGGYEVRIANCGSLYAGPVELEKKMARMKELPLRRGDIVIVHLDNLSFSGITELNLMDVLVQNHIEVGWIWDTAIRHGNHKVNAMYAKAIYDVLRNDLIGTIDGQGKKIQEAEDVVKELYIDRHFADFNPELYEKIGSIVMNCNPFTYGHRYLIEQAHKMVDFLIIFVVEEDASLFSFEERFAMVCEGTKDLDHVMVVPSGEFILSKTSFPEYFVKETDEDTVRNVECDITCFAEKIVPYLNISYRFVGEEPEDMVTNEYNLAMKRILPPRGVGLIEIPRKEQNGNYISASRVRRCLEEMDLEKLQELVPESTAKLLLYC